MFALDTRAIKASNQQDVVSGSNQFTLPSDFLVDLRVALDGIRLVRLSKFDLDFTQQSDWQTETSANPGYYYIGIRPDFQKLIVWPTPTFNSTNGMAIEYIAIPAVMSSDSDIPFNSHSLMTPYHNAIVYWVGSELLLINVTTENLAKAKAYAQKYREIVADCIDTFRAWERPERVRLNGGRYYKGL